MTSASLGGLKQLVNMYTYTLVYLPSGSHPRLRTVAGGSYLGVSNIDPDDISKPSTAVMWLDGIEGGVVANLVSRYLQYISFESLPLRLHKLHHFDMSVFQKPKY